MEICLKCLSLNIVRNENTFSCNDCRFYIDVFDYATIYNNSLDAVRFGYQYRIRYENDRRRNISGRSYYLPPPSEVFVFLASSIVAGIIGGFSHDLFKEALNRIKSNSLIIKIDDPELKKFLESEAKQKKFIKYIQMYRDKELEKQKKRHKKR